MVPTLGCDRSPARADESLFIVFFFIYRKQVKENADIALVRTKKANKMAVRRLKNAGKLMKENKKEEFYDEGFYCTG